MSCKQKIYRYNFSDSFLSNLKEFSKIHKFDESDAFKDNWSIWCDNNKELNEKENNILKNEGYKGDIMEKMYKSVRYYFKNKDNNNNKPKKRKQYIGLEPGFRDAIDNHIEYIAFRRELKPSEGYLNFMDNEKYKKVITFEKLKLAGYKLSKEDIEKKLKKTYKNRYFIKKEK